jgi:6-phosphogluconolactonase (cycloisomerase 2 family)
MKLSNIRIFLAASILLVYFGACSDAKTKKKNVSIGNINMANSLFLLIGTYTTGGSDGIYVYRFDTVDGSSDYLSQSTSVENPSYLTLSKNNNRVYSVTENGDTSACANAFTFDRKTSVLDLENSSKTDGAAPCYINMDPTEKFVLTANYEGGTITVIRLEKDGTLSNDRDIIGFRQGVKLPFRRRSHLHTTVFSPDGKYLLATDLGKDKLYCFETNRQAQRASEFLSTTKLSVVDLEIGSGPRHLAFHPNGKMFYLLNEFSGKVNVFNYHEGKISEIQTVTADGFKGRGSADIHITPNGKFLYTSHRLKNDGISIFSISKDDGKLTKIGYQPTGIHPRNFIITPNGKMLLVANRDSNSIQVFSINQSTGMLNNLNKDIQIDKPVCLKFASVEG